MNVFVFPGLNFNKFLLSLSGLTMFLVAPTLCENIVFQYTSGTVLGVLGSVLIIIYFTSRLIPKVTVLFFFAFFFGFFLSGSFNY